ncbi:putative rare lipoprotein A [Treponema pallidum subsp. pallidum str. Sea 81-4]|nr:putative rare lipoprotein A [Treponema pallidum subsp. pallidum str. Sea 81-4]ANA42666.1 putative rare lipoprotein A [Treponema pallidum subsp. pallidum]
MDKRVVAVAAVLWNVQMLFAAGEVIVPEGYASYYAESFNGRPTASGEIFDMNAYTAAHRTLPFGTVVELTNLDNGKKVIVRINDRGPYAANREIDVSKAAAVALDMLNAGVARVSIHKADPNAHASQQRNDRQTSPGVLPQDSFGVPPTAPTSSAPVMYADPHNPPPAPVGRRAGTPGVPGVANTTDVPASEYGAPPVAYAAPGSTPSRVPYGTAVPGSAAPNSHAQPVPSSSSYAAAAPLPYAAGGGKVSGMKSVYTPTHSGETRGVLWRIQLGAFVREENALRLVVKLREAGFDPSYERTEHAVRVVLPGIRPADLERVKHALKRGRFHDYVIRQESW